MVAVYTVVNTEELPVGERFASWREILWQAVVPVELRSDHENDFRAEARSVDVGAVRATLMAQPSMESLRTPKLIRKSDPESYHLCINVRGHVLSTQDRRSFTLGPGDLVLVDSSRPFHCIADGGTDRCVGLTLTFPRTLLPLPDNKVEQLLHVRLPGGGIGPLLSRYLVELIRPDDQWRPADAARLATVTLDLATAMLAHHLEADEQLPGETRQRALLARIYSFIQQHLGDPALTPSMIAAAHGISTRSLHRLFHAGDFTVTGWIRARRLDRCRRDLADPHFRSRPVHAIAARWGLPDAAHFSRAFRAMYGLSPQAYRQKHGTPARSDI